MQDRKESKINMDLVLKIIGGIIAVIGILFVISFILIKCEFEHIQDIGEENIVEEFDKEFLAIVKEKDISLYEGIETMAACITFFAVVSIIGILIFGIGFCI